MFSVSPEIYQTLFLVSRYLFAFFALCILFFSLSWLYAEHRNRKDRFRTLPGAGTIGEMVVLSGSDQLPENTWFPVPREGTLGSLRTCDLVVPCPGVQSRHLDFSWQDGVGLLLRPRSGCEAFVDGSPIVKPSDAENMPLVHGSSLQVGTAVLRLQVYTALANTASPALTLPEQQDMNGYQDAAAVIYPPANQQFPMFPAPMDPVQPFLPEQTGVVSPGIQNHPGSETQTPEGIPACPPIPQQMHSGEPLPVFQQQAAPVPVPEAPQRRRRSDRWKEDWSE